MADYVTVDSFKQGWDFFTKKIYVAGVGDEWGKFPCSDFACSGCNDWLDCDKPNRKVTKIFQYISKLLSLENFVIYTYS